MKEELKHLIGKTVVEIKRNTIYFDDGTSIEFHPFETYVNNPN
ncbi:hypothetical protein [Bacillus sp. MCCB 382]